MILSNPNQNIVVSKDPETLAVETARRFVTLAQAAIAERGRFDVCLSGGSTPKGLYQVLARPDGLSLPAGSVLPERKTSPFGIGTSTPHKRGRTASASRSTSAVHIDWTKIHVFWGDERCVPPDHADSNFRMAKESLLDNLQFPEANIHRIKGELDALEAAADYEAQLADHFGDEPRFDLILLGLGDDGHTASLFPGTPALDERSHWAVAVTHRGPPPPLIDRVTLTYPVLNAARQVIFLVSGKNKEERLRAVLRDPPDLHKMPAQGIHPTDGTLTWMVDSTAAGLLEIKRS
jgi:6-phosphogluconolactonase